jgi:nitroreductase
MTTPTVTPCHVLTRRQVLDLARAAHQAPSIHNTQPWRLRTLDDGLDVEEDPARGLTATDPLGRERLISCGAAARNAEVTLARLGYAPVTTLLPDGLAATRVASIHAGTARTPPPEVDVLYRAIWTRRTHRRIFLTPRSNDHLLPVADAAVTPFGAHVALLPASRRERFARLVWSAAQQQVRDEERRSELAEWTRPERTADGVPVRSQATAPFPVDGLLTRPRAVAEIAPSSVVEDLAHGTVAVLSIVRQGRLEWLQAGRALENLLLTLSGAGMVASFLNQAVQRDEFRTELAALVDEPGVPQVVLRIGEPLVTVPATPRRPLAEVLTN